MAPLAAAAAAAYRPRAHRTACSSCCARQRSSSTLHQQEHWRRRAKSGLVLVVVPRRGEGGCCGDMQRQRVDQQGICNSSNSSNNSNSRAAAACAAAPAAAAVQPRHPPKYEGPLQLPQWCRVPRSRVLIHRQQQRGAPTVTGAPPALSCCAEVLRGAAPRSVCAVGRRVSARVGFLGFSSRAPTGPCWKNPRHQHLCQHNTSAALSAQDGLSRIARHPHTWTAHTLTLPVVVLIFLGAGRGRSLFCK